MATELGNGAGQRGLVKGVKGGGKRACDASVREHVFRHCQCAHAANLYARLDHVEGSGQHRRRRTRDEPTAKRGEEWELVSWDATRSSRRYRLVQSEID